MVWLCKKPCTPSGIRPVKKKGALLSKLTLKKLMIAWSGVFFVLLYFFKFPLNAYSLILSFISSSSMTILVNRDTTESYLLSRGICSLSPYIFILCMEFFSLLIEKEVYERNWHPLKVGLNGPAITHSLFTDDIVLFSMDDYSTIKRVLDTFCVAFGQTVIQHKSHFCTSKNMHTSRICYTQHPFAYSFLWKIFRVSCS